VTGPSFTSCTWICALRRPRSSAWTRSASSCCPRCDMSRTLQARRGASESQIANTLRGAHPASAATPDKLPKMGYLMLKWLAGGEPRSHKKGDARARISRDIRASERDLGQLRPQDVQPSCPSSVLDVGDRPQAAHAPPRRLAGARSRADLGARRHPASRSASRNALPGSRPSRRGAVGGRTRSARRCGSIDAGRVSRSSASVGRRSCRHQADGGCVSESSPGGRGRCASPRCGSSCSPPPSRSR